MNIIDAPNMPAEYRLYETEHGAYVRVRVKVLDAAQGRYSLTAQVTDNDGTLEGFETPTHMLTVSLDQADISPFSDQSETDVAGNKGDLIRVNGKLYEYDGGWIYRGPISSGATAAIAETIATWDKAARPLVIGAVRTSERATAAQTLNALLGT